LVLPVGSRSCNSRLRGQAMREPSQPKGMKPCTLRRQSPRSLTDTAAEGGGDRPQGPQGDAGEGLGEALQGRAGLAALAEGGDVEGAGGLETLGGAVAGGPGHDEQDQDERVALPVVALVGAEGGGDLLPELGGEKVAEGVEERLGVGSVCGGVRGRVRHRRPPPGGSCGHKSIMAEGGVLSCASWRGKSRALAGAVFGHKAC